MTTPTTQPEPSRWRARLSRVLNWLSPFYLLWRMQCRLWREQRRRAAQLVKLLGESERELAITRARWRQAIEQRDRCRDLAAALCGQSDWTESDRAFLDEYDIEVER